MSALARSLAGGRSRGHGSRTRILLLALLSVATTLVAASCGGSGGPGGASAGSSSRTVTLYTCASDEAVQAVVAGFERGHPGASLRVFRAPTGDLNARIAADVRSGGLKADVVWACDPLTMRDYVGQGLVGGWTPADATGIPAEFRTPDYVGAHVLYVIAVTHDGVPVPRTWRDLTTVDGKVAVPDPNVAASALGALGFFAQSPEYGVGFYRDLRDHGAVRVSTPDDVVTGVAQGIYAAGISIATSAYQAQEDGSPIEVTWPAPGGVAVYGPIGLARASRDVRTARDFIEYVVGRRGQRAVADAGSYPAMEGVPGPRVPENAEVVYPDWASIGADQDDLLNGYQSVFGG